MVFQTYVARAGAARRRSPASALTHFQFTNRGKPIVFHDDHADYVRTLDRFFVRKVSPEAQRLRAACLALAARARRRRAARPDRHAAATTTS